MDLKDLIKKLEELEDNCTEDFGPEYYIGFDSAINKAIEVVKSTLAPVSLDEQSEATVCKHCGETKDKHSTASELCTTKFKHFEAN